MQVRTSTLDGETFDSAGGWIAKLDSKLPRFLSSPVLRVMSSSPVVQSRRLMQRLVDTGGGVTRENMAGRATADSVEMQANQVVNQRKAATIQMRNQLYAEYALETDGNALSKYDFGAEVMKAWSNGDAHEIPQVSKMAKFLRKYFDEDGKALRESGATEDEYHMLGPNKSYGPRVWDNGKITADRSNFEEWLYNHFSRYPKTEEVPEVESRLAPPKLGEGSAQTFLDEFHAQHPEEAPVGMTGKRVGKANVALSQDANGVVHVDMVRADTPGSALPALRKIIKLADKHGVTLQADAAPVGTGGPSKEDLVKLYEHGGFKLAPETANGTSTTMIRPGINERAKAPGVDLAALQKKHLAAQPEETVKAAVGPPKPIERDPVEIRDAVQNTIDNIQHAVRGTADIGTGVRNPKSTQARKLVDVNDNEARPWLSDDFDHVVESYYNTMTPHIMMRKEFGSIDLQREVQEISDAYRVKLTAAGDNDKVKADLVKKRESDVKDVLLVRDRLLGQAGARNDQPLAWIRSAQAIRSINYIRSLGSQVFSALPDLGRVVAQYGLKNTGAKIAKLAVDSDFRNMAKADMQRLGTALDVVLHTREHSLQGAGDEAGGVINKFLQNQTAKFTKYSLIAHWDASIRLLSVLLEQDKIGRLVQGEDMSALDRGRLAAHGIGDEELAGIKDQWLKYGSSDDGLHRAQTDLWEDKDAARKVEQAIQRAASTNAFFIGKGDLPSFADSQFGKFMLQFKGFAMGSVSRLVLPLAQGLAHGDVKAANGLAVMLALGGSRYVLKEMAAGRQPDTSPGNLASESLIGSGVLAFLPDIYDPVASVTNLPRFSKFQGRDATETVASAVGGPMAGTIANVAGVVQRATGGHMTAQDLHKMRQLVPYNNLFYLSRLVNMVEGETADALNLKNAPHKDAADYFNPSKDTPARQDNSKEHFLGIQAVPNHF